ncbi:unnamed protein product [Brassica oleracea]
MITCICSCSFCWRCLRSEEEQNGNWNCVEVSFQPSMSQEVEDSRYLRLWETCLQEYCRRWITPFHKAHQIIGPNPASWISLVGSAAKRIGSTLECF